jgi:HKD family nuclease
MREKVIAAAKKAYPRKDAFIYAMTSARPYCVDRVMAALAPPKPSQREVEEILLELAGLAPAKGKPVSPRPGPPQSANGLVEEPPSALIPIMSATRGTEAPYLDILRNVLRMMTPQELMALRLVSRTYRELAEGLLLRSIGLRGVHSLDPMLRGGLMATIKAEVQKAATVRISVDKMTDKRLLSDIFGSARAVRSKLKALNAGSDTSALKAVPSEVKTLLVPKHGDERMHTKFFVLGGDTVISGSPNISYAAMEKNSECVILIESPWIASLFREYFGRIQNYSESDSLRGEAASSQLEAVAPGFQQRLAEFNARSPVRVALAPFADIGEFFYTELSKAKGDDLEGVRIVVRQYLVSQDKTNPKDLLKCLVELSKAGADVTVVVDRDAYYNDATYYFVQPALAYLNDGGVTCVLQERDLGSGGTGLMHDKMILIEYSQNNKITKTVLAGSAGFSKNVLNNRNWEVMISADEDALYDYFDAVHRRTLQSGSGVTNYTWR